MILEISAAPQVVSVLCSQEVNRHHLPNLVLPAQTLGHL